MTKSRKYSQRTRRGRGWMDTLGKVTNEFVNPNSLLRGTYLPQAFGMAQSAKQFADDAGIDTGRYQGAFDVVNQAEEYNKLVRRAQEGDREAQVALARMGADATGMSKPRPKAVSAAGWNDFIGKVSNEFVNPNSLLRGTYLPMAGMAAGVAAEIAAPDSAIGRAAGQVASAAETNALITAAQNGDREAQIKLARMGVSYSQGKSPRGKSPVSSSGPKEVMAMGYGSYPRRSNPKASARGKMVAALMRKHGVSLGEASKMVSGGMYLRYS